MEADEIAKECIQPDEMEAARLTIDKLSVELENEKEACRKATDALAVEKETHMKDLEFIKNSKYPVESEKVIKKYKSNFKSLKYRI